MDKLDAFLHIYFYQIERILNTTTTDIINVKFQSEEANFDEHLKLFFKSFIRDHNKISNDYISKIKIIKGDHESQFISSDIKDYIISNVLLPIDLTAQHKEVIQKQKKSIYTNPDLYLEVLCQSEIHYITVELKSTKDNKIPGSSIQQIAPYEWVIFVQHKNNKTKVVTGCYIT